ncbi:MAG TPA: hypothetical protein VFE53_13170 [Mucilaginibacter sp.]|jgi:hypothetical protein|nr:hypothetical protein [Mucilaginibacter sp.]
MKRSVLLLSVIACLASCNKGNPLTPALFGKWEVTRVYGGNIYPPDSVYKPGNGNILQLNSDSTFARYVKNVLTAQGIFHTRKNGFSTGQTSYDEIWFSPDTSFKSVITLNGRTLTLKPLIPDISTTDYQKMGDQ